MMAELAKDIFCHNVQSAGAMRPGKENREFMSSSFPAEQFLFCSTGCPGNLF
jgi:hypothetical protein